MTVEVIGAKKLQGIFKQLHDMTPVKRGLQAGAAHVKGKIAEYPAVRRLTRKSVYGRTFVSDKQRRFFFAALREGRIEVPYRRGFSPSSEAHGRSWTIHGSADGLTQTVGSDTSYGPLLQDRNRQSAYHRAVGWRTIQEVAQDELSTVRAFIGSEIRRVL